MHTAAVDSSPSAEVRASARATEGAVVLCALLVFPIALYAVHLAPFGRYLYPAVNLVVAAWLFAKRSPWYAGHCVLLFCFVSLVRRLIDEQAGWDPSNPVLLTPYLCCFPTILAFLDYWAERRPRYIGPFLVILGCVVYGTLLAMIHERVLSSLIDALKWTVGPLFATYVLANHRMLPHLREVVEPCLIAAGVAMSLYGILQFISPPTWDALWMRNVETLGLNSIGQPQPFQVRVFSTMNSPGSFGIVLSAAIILGLKRRFAVSVPAIALMAVGLGLSQYRSIWGATAFSLLLVLVSRGGRVAFSRVIALVVIAMLAGTTAVVPNVREAITQRAATLSSLKGDKSLEGRLQQYADLVRADNLIAGEGLAIHGASRRLDNKPVIAIDGALIEVMRAMGVFVGALFLAALATAVLSVFRVRAGADPAVFFDRAIVAGLFVQLPIGSVQAGELGFCAWMFMGFALATGLRGSNA